MSSSFSKLSTSGLDRIKIQKDIYQDFQREVYCLFGFPVDHLSLESASKLIKNQIINNNKTVISTLNVNWVAYSFKKPDFRAAILNSDICTLDGMPLVFFARCIGLPIQDVVAGSSLIEYLRRNGDPQDPISIFLFGGNCNVAEKAFTKINASAGGLKAVGHHNPGFGPIKTISDKTVIQKINASSPDILLVALGAIKGTLWIEKNRKKLNCHIISHLGATIHFLAGTVKRAPLFFQKMAIEWVWRIFTEPPLLRRYINDGLLMLRTLTPKSLFIIKFNSLNRKHAQKKLTANIVFSEKADWITLTFGKQFTRTHKAFVQQTFYDTAIKNKNILLDFNDTEFVDSAFMAYLLLLLKHQKRNGKEVKVFNIRNRLRQIFNFNFVTASMESLDIPIYFTKT